MQIPEKAKPQIKLRFKKQGNYASQFKIQNPIINKYAI